MKPLAALAISISILLAQSERPASKSVTAVRNWSLGEITRVAIEISGEFEFRTDRLHNPERVYFDIVGARPSFEGKRSFRQTFDDDKLVRGVRVAETTPGVTRIVLDLNADAEVTTSRLANPTRLMIEARATRSAPVIPTESAPAPPVVRPTPTIKADLPPSIDAPKLPAPTPTKAVEPPPQPVKPAAVEPPPQPAPVAAKPATDTNKPVTAPSAEVGKAARHNSAGGSNLTRALGLKIGRIVIDPGHGGHDQGTTGVKGLVEKDLVLDVAQRVGKLIEEKMNAEVVYTRTDDTFIPLGERTTIANERKADLFLSIHANSSPYPRISGVETFYLNFTDSKEAMDVAARENATSEKSVYDLQDLTHKIALHEKLDESREFASRIQTALFTFTSHNVPNEKNRGIKKAPFVVLIGANMPSVLAEIGFLTNVREEALLRKPEYRQKLADALYRGLSRYAESLSHFQVAQTKE
jgi:N-acetylmuramoyl-L-alanine amidase